MHKLCCIQFIWNARKGKCGDRKTAVVFLGLRGGLPTKRIERICWLDGNVPYSLWVVIQLYIFVRLYWIRMFTSVPQVLGCLLIGRGRTSAPVEIVKQFFKNYSSFIDALGRTVWYKIIRNLSFLFLKNCISCLLLKLNWFLIYWAIYLLLWF